MILRNVLCTLPLCLLAMATSGCLDVEVGGSAPQDEAGIVEEGHDREAARPPGDGLEGAPAVPTNTNESVKSIRRPMFFFDCRLESALIPEPYDGLEDDLPPGWEPAELAGGRTWLSLMAAVCESSSRNNITYTTAATFSFVAVAVRPPNEYDHGGGADQFLFWGTADTIWPEAVSWGAPLSNDTVQASQEGPVAMFAVSSTQGSWNLSLTEGSSGDADLEFTSYLHYDDGVGFGAIEIRVHAVEAITSGGLSRLDSTVPGPSAGPALSTSYRGWIEMTQWVAG